MTQKPPLRSARRPHLIPPSLEESGFMEVECFTILYIVTIRKMRLSCQNKRHVKVKAAHFGREAFIS